MGTVELDAEELIKWHGGQKAANPLDLGFWFGQSGRFYHLRLPQPAKKPDAARIGRTTDVCLVQADN
jgi:hypothetical protein